MENIGVEDLPIVAYNVGFQKIQKLKDGKR